jgi:hypothetical protein
VQYWKQTRSESRACLSKTGARGSAPTDALGQNYPSVLLVEKADSLDARHIPLKQRARTVRRTIIAHHDFEVSVSLAERTLTSASPT